MALAPAPQPDEPSVVLRDGVLVIRDLDIDDPTVVEAARRHLAADPAADLGAWAASLVSLAARAVGLATGAVDDGVVARALEGLSRRVDESAAAAAVRVESAVVAATDPDRGAVARSVQGSLARLAEEVGRLVAGEDAPLRTAVEAALARSSQAALAEIGRALAAQTESVRSALSPDDPAGPLNVLRRESRESNEALRAELLRHLVELRGMVEAARARDAALTKASSYVGSTYEEAVGAALTEAAGALGDSVEATGSAVGAVAKCKVGDFVASVAGRTTGGAAVTVAVEAKSASLSSAAWKRELGEARRNRGASGALGVVRGVDLMPGKSRAVFVVDPANVIVAWEPGEPTDLLAAAYQLTRAAAVANALRDAGEGHPDAARLAAAMREAHAALDAFDVILRAEATSRRGLDEIRRAATQLRLTLERHLAEGLGGDERLGA